MINQVKYLQSINDFPKIGLIFFENSGENLLKYYLENIFKIKVGSNINNYDPVDNYWIIASDYPLRDMKNYKEVSITSAILLVRNPIDVIISKVLNSDDIEDSIKNINAIIQQWKEFYKYWINSPIPVYIVRYEDLLVNPYEILLEMSIYALGAKSLLNSKLEYNIKKAVESCPQKELYAYDIELEDDNKILTYNTLSDLRDKFMTQMDKMFQKFNYEIGDKSEIDNWLFEFNKDNIVRTVDFHEFLENQIMTSNYVTLKLG